MALLTDAMVSTRIAHALGGVPRRLRDHAIVCGLGTVGFRIASELQDESIPAAEPRACGRDRRDRRRCGTGSDPSQPRRPGRGVAVLRHRQRVLSRERDGQLSGR
jgi:hypothetical protein